jgi:hypothetical protein
MTARNALISLFLTLFWIALSTPTAKAQDSLQVIPVPKYVLWRMFHDIQTGKVCDSLQYAQGEAIQNGLQLILVQDSLIQLRGSQIGNLTQEAKWWEERYANQVRRTEQEKAETRRWKFATIVGGVFIVIITIL